MAGEPMPNQGYGPIQNHAFPDPTASPYPGAFNSRTVSGIQMPNPSKSGIFSLSGGSKSSVRIAASSFAAGGGKAYVGTTDVNEVPDAAQASSAFLKPGSLLQAVLSRGLSVAWVVYLFFALVISYMNTSDPDAFGNAFGLSVATAVCFLARFLSEEDTHPKYVNMAMSVTLAMVGAYGCLYALSAAGLGVPANAGVMVFLVFLALVVFIASPVHPSESLRRSVMYLLFLVAACIHVSQILSAFTTNTTVGIAKVQATCGSALLMLCCYYLSTNQMGINSMVVGYGFIMQYFLGMFVLTTETGQNIFNFLGEGATFVLNMSWVGSSSIIGQSWNKYSFAFAVLPTTIYFSALISALTYMGVLQVCVKAVAGALKKVVGTNLIQSINAAANLFLGMTEAPLLILPFLSTASPSDIHCVMVGGFASIAGAVLVAYISMGIPAAQLLGASVMSVPGTLVIANLVCPPGSYPEEEVEKEEGAGDDDFEFPIPSESNVVEAAGNGTQTAIALVLNIGAMLISFLSLLALVDAGLGFLGSLVGEEMSFQVITSFLFWPVAFILGTPAEDCSRVASVIGSKVMVNEFVAYQELQKLITDNVIQPQSALVATYACCGFANVGSIGIMLGAMATLCPARAKLFAKVVVRALLAGNVVSWINASYAAVLLNASGTSTVTSEAFANGFHA